jgi:hypothetical protein
LRRVRSGPATSRAREGDVDGGTALVLLFTAVTGAVGPATDAGRAYADALVGQRWEDAHAMLCGDSQARITPEQLADQYAARR